MQNPMLSEEDLQARAARARKRQVRKLAFGGATLIVMGVVLTWGMVALMSEPPPEMALPPSADEAAITAPAVPAG